MRFAIRSRPNPALGSPWQKSSHGLRDTEKLRFSPCLGVSVADGSVPRRPCRLPPRPAGGAGPRRRQPEHRLAAPAANRDDIIAKLRPQFAGLVGMRVYMQNPPTVRIGGQVSKSLYQYSLQSPDRDELYAAARGLTKALEDLPELEDLTSDLQVTSPQVNVQIDRDKAAALGVTANQIENAFYDAYGPRWVSTIYAAVNEYKVLLELAPQFQADPSALSLLYFKASPGQTGGGSASGSICPRSSPVGWACVRTLIYAPPAAIASIAASKVTLAEGARSAAVSCPAIEPSVTASGKATSSDNQVVP